MLDADGMVERLLGLFAGKEVEVNPALRPQLVTEGWHAHHLRATGSRVSSAGVQPQDAEELSAARSPLSTLVGP